MIKSLLVVGAGSFLGGALRYFISAQMKCLASQGFPWGTLAVNLLGCLLFGVIIALFHKHGAQAGMWCLLFTTGFCGGFTTFSTFVYEGTHMLYNGNFFLFFAYVAASVILGLGLVALGFWVAK